MNFNNRKKREYYGIYSCFSTLAATVITPDNIIITEDHIIELIEKIMKAVNNS